MEFNKSQSKLKLGEIISKSFKLVVNNALEILKITGIFLVPVFLVIIGLLVALIFALIGIIGTGIYRSSPDELILVFFKMIIPLLIFTILVMVVSLVSYFGYGIIIKVLGDRYKGQDTGWKDSMKYVWEKKWSLIGMNLLILLISFVAYIVIMIVSSILTAVTFGIGLIIIFPILIALAVIVSAVFMLFNSMLITKDLRAMDAIKQTFRLFKKGSFWRMIGKCAALSGITNLAILAIVLLAMVPLLGVIVAILAIVGQVYVQSFLIAACNIIVIEDMEPQDGFSEVNFIE
ncbi:hypothetical protein [Clostridium gasigenes]|uniref:hypothetical protein n=1 Tax=Clostridium gasigenes TaxID=94869 RepID=UPI001C0B73A5|nr:hypothetical protein [Clostridium gasigenes]MBU3109753.1 hypothetical protein [Clostridium gasigenes]